MTSFRRFGCLFLGLTCSLAFAARTEFDAGWRFALGDVSGAEQVDFPDEAWRILDLPHDWTVEGTFDPAHPNGDRGGYLPTGIGWYRKTMDVPAAWRGQRVAIEFDGVFRNSTVWANGVELGTRPYGWISFGYDISEIAASAERITFAVRVDNELQPAARWYSGSGIYGHTWINVRDAVHVPTSGVWLRTEGDVVLIDTEVVNTGAESTAGVVRTAVVDAAGQVVASVEAPFGLGAGAMDTVAQRITLTGAHRWSPESPYLYRAISEVGVGHVTRDRVETRFGVRDIAWRPGTGMWLNGENVKLRGVCQHQHAGAFGAAVPTKMMRYRIEQMKAMGVNSIRAAHNPHTPQFYDLCDELGIIVMDEFVDGWGKKAQHDYGAHHFADWWRRDLTDWIKRDRNHPSVFLWSVGNETHGEVGRELVELCHELDPTRPVTSGASEPQFMDIVGINGGSEGKDWFKQNMPTDRVFIGTENTHTWQTRGYYRTQTWYRDGPLAVATEIPNLTPTEIFTVDWTDNSQRANRKQFYKSSYDNSTVRSPARRAIAQIRDLPNNAGMYRWTGHDYLGEAGLASGGWPFKLFSGGTVDLANFEKDHFYLYQSQWTTAPMVHVVPHWTHPVMAAGTEIPVWVYSNCDEVELFLNGRSLGRRRPGTAWQEMQCEWFVGWEPGELVAVGYRDGMEVARHGHRTAGTPASLALSVDGEPLASVGKDLAQVRVAFRDAQGTFYPYGENRVFFGLTGPARLKALDNGRPDDVEPFYGTTDRRGFFGLARAYVEATGEPGAIGLLAGAILGDKKLVVADQVHIDVQHLALRGTAPTLSWVIHYTVDGTEPTTASPRYTGGFTVPLGTTVKAVVVAVGATVLRLEERFAADVGLLWSGGGLDTDFGGDQAEDARVVGAPVSDQTRNFNGTGFVDFRGATDAYVEWYRENDGGVAARMLSIRYSGRPDDHGSMRLRLNVNDDAQTETIELPPTPGWGTQWRTVVVPITLQRGANTIRLTAVDDRGAFLDEIELYAP